MPSAIVNATSANMRAAPGADATVAAVLVQGASVDILANNDDNTWLLVSAVIEGTTRIGWIRADLVNIGGVPPPANKPAPGEKTGPALPNTGPKPVGEPAPFTTKPSASGNLRGQSSTTGLVGTEQKFDDGSLVIEAIEKLAAIRAGGFNASLAASCRRVSKGDVTTVEQDNYCYAGRQLPLARLFLKSDGIPATVPDGFEATPPVPSVIASQFGKNDHEDEGTGTPAMGLVQTNSEVYGASIKVSKMAEHFGENWTKNSRRLGTLIEVHSTRSRRRAQVPLVDVGPSEAIPAEVDLSWACDQFLDTKGHGEVSYRLLIPL
jgi:Bacterial SH3 domain